MRRLIPDEWKSNTADMFWVLGTVIAFLSAFSGKTPTGKIVRWLWRRNVGEPVSGWAKGLIRETVQPMIADSRAEIMTAARTQHETQNDKLDGIDQRVSELENKRPPHVRTRKDDR